MSKRKSPQISFILLVFFGFLGAHSLYLGEYKKSIKVIGLTLSLIASVFFLPAQSSRVAILVIGILILFALIRDAFYLHRQVSCGSVKKTIRYLADPLIVLSIAVFLFVNNRLNDETKISKYQDFCEEFISNEFFDGKPVSSIYTKRKGYNYIYNVRRTSNGQQLSHRCVYNSINQTLLKPSVLDDKFN